MGILGRRSWGGGLGWGPRVRSLWVSLKAEILGWESWAEVLGQGSWGGGSGMGILGLGSWDGGHGLILHDIELFWCNSLHFYCFSLTGYRLTDGWTDGPTDRQTNGQTYIEMRRPRALFI